MSYQALRLLFLVNVFTTLHVDYCHGRREWHDNFYDFTVKNIEGKRVRLEKYRGTVSTLGGFLAPQRGVHGDALPLESCAGPS